MGNTDQEKHGWRELREGGNLTRLVVVCFGVWLHAADGLMVVTMMPAIIGEIGGARFISWTISLYEIGSIIAGASGAFLCVRYGLRAAMSGAALIYMVGCAISALAPEMSVMLIGRLAQGLGGGGLVALSFIAVTLLFSRSLMPRVMAAVSALWGVSAFIGPLVGGVFADLGLWRGGFWFFAVQAAVLAMVIGLSSAITSQDAESEVKAAGKPPLLRLGILSLGVLAIAWSGIEISVFQTPLFILAGLVLLGLFLRMDGRQDDRRLLPPRPVDPRDGVGAALLMVLTFSSATIAYTVYGPLLIIQIHGLSALAAGYIVAASSIGWSVMAILVSGAGERHDGRLIVGGMTIVTLSILGLAVALPYGPLWLVLVFAIFEGAGFGMAWTFILRRLTALAPKSEKERAASSMPTFQRLGYALGAAYVGIIANAAGIVESMEQATAQAVGFWIFAACLPLAFIGLLAAWRFARADVANERGASGEMI